MLNQCFNPHCKRDLLYLRDGRVVRLVNRQREKTNVEHFWLCGACHVRYDFHFSSSDGLCMVATRATWRSHYCRISIIGIRTD